MSSTLYTSVFGLPIPNQVASRVACDAHTCAGPQADANCPVSQLSMVQWRRIPATHGRCGVRGERQWRQGRSFRVNGRHWLSRCVYGEVPIYLIDSVLTMYGSTLCTTHVHCNYMRPPRPFSLSPRILRLVNALTPHLSHQASS